MTKTINKMIYLVDSVMFRTVYCSGFPPSIKALLQIKSSCDPVQIAVF